jgi:hypothetical protein
VRAGCLADALGAGFEAVGIWSGRIEHEQRHVHARGGPVGVTGRA